MGACVKVGNKKSACLYIDREVLEAAKKIGLNASKVAENALVEAIRRLSDPKRIIRERAFDGFF